MSIASPHPSRKLKRWQRSYVALHALKINWGDSDDERISVSNGTRQWYLKRQDIPEYWTRLSEVMRL